MLSDIVSFRTTLVLEVAMHLNGELLSFHLMFRTDFLPETAGGCTVGCFDKERVRDCRGDEVLDCSI